MKKRFFAMASVLIAILMSVSLSAVVRPQGNNPFQLKAFNMILLTSTGQGELSGKTKTAHLAYLDNLASSGKAILVGDISGKGQYRGVIIVDEQPKDKVTELASADPAVHSGDLTFNILKWETDPNAFGMGQAQTPIKMSNYYFEMIQLGPKFNPQQMQEMGQKHIASVMELMKAGKLVLAGHFDDAGNLAGIFVVKAASAEEAKSLAESDGTIQAGWLSLAETQPMSVPKGMLK